MKPTTKFLLFLIFVTTVVALVRLMGTDQLSSQTADTETQSSFETKEDSGGDVTVSVTPVELSLGFPASFDLTFETHSVDLDFDVEGVATLTDGKNTPFTGHWDGSPPGGHHRSGTLRFTPELDKSKTLTLTLRDIAGIAERTFTWEVQK